MRNALRKDAQRSAQTVDAVKMTLFRSDHNEIPWGTNGFLHGRTQNITADNTCIERTHGSSEHICV
jgi:hypothetical protein